MTFVVPTAHGYEVMHRFANPRGGRGALTHEQYAFVVLVVPGLAAQYRAELDGTGTMPVARYGDRVLLPAGASGQPGADLHGHAGRSCGHAHAGAEFVHSPAGDDVDWAALSGDEVLCLAEKPVRVFLAGEGGTGKTHVVSNVILNAAFRMFLGKYCDAQPLAFTNRAAGLYGQG